MPDRQPTPADLRRLANHEDAAGNHDRANALRWLRSAEHWGEWIRYSDDRSGAPESIWMMKSTTGPEVRFYARGKGQVGARHAHVVAATYWAYANRWVRPENDFRMELTCRAEVLAGGVPKGANGA